MAYLRRIPKHMCDYCKAKAATQELINWRNAPSGRFCTAHAKMALVRLRKDEEASCAKQSTP